MMKSLPDDQHAAWHRNHQKPTSGRSWIWLNLDHWGLEFRGIVRNQFWSSGSPMDPNSSKFLGFALEIAITRTYQMMWYSYLSFAWKFMYLSLLFHFDNIHKLVVLFNNWTLLEYWDYSRIYYTPYLLWIDASSAWIGTIRITHTVNSCTMSLCVSNIPTNFDYWPPLATELSAFRFGNGMSNLVDWWVENSGIQLPQERSSVVILGAPLEFQPPPWHQSVGIEVKAKLLGNDESIPEWCRRKEGLLGMKRFGRDLAEEPFYISCSSLF